MTAPRRFPRVPRCPPCRYTGHGLGLGFRVMAHKQNLAKLDPDAFIQQCAAPSDPPRQP